MGLVPAREKWGSWIWTAWAAATIAAVLSVGIVSLGLYTFIDVCGSFDDPLAAAVHELQAVLACLIVLSIAGWLLAARLTGRWWLLACLSAAATVALPAQLLLTHLSVASWASVGFCSM